MNDSQLPNRPRRSNGKSFSPPPRLREFPLMAPARPFQLFADPVDPANNAAFVAVHTGYEVQIDEEARGDTRFSEPDGFFFSRTGAIYKIKTLGTGPGQQNYQNHANLAAEQWHR